MAIQAYAVFVDVHEALVAQVVIHSIVSVGAGKGPAATRLRKIPAGGLQSYDAAFWRTPALLHLPKATAARPPPARGFSTRQLKKKVMKR